VITCSEAEIAQRCVIAGAAAHNVRLFVSLIPPIKGWIGVAEEVSDISLPAGRLGRSASRPSSSEGNWLWIDVRERLSCRSISSRSFGATFSYSEAPPLNVLVALLEVAALERILHHVEQEAIAGLTLGSSAGRSSAAPWMPSEPPASP
jgi:hypothetical protein